MLGFKTFIVESLETEKLKHLEHAEDHPINVGAAGFDHAVNTLHEVHKAVTGKPSKATITTKFDGSPSVVFGHHPETGKFFVASKSAFNKNPKLNYTPEDVEKNHGHAPGLVAKLKDALEHLPKTTPKKGVYQGDLMYSGDDVKEHDGKVHFTPNTITYSTPANSKQGKKITNSKLGVVVHTKYKGTNLEDMKATFAPSLKNFSKHPDVNVINPQSSGTAKLTPEQNKTFKSEIAKAQELHKDHNYDHLEGHREHVSTYINQTVRNDTKPTVQGLRSHVEKRYQAQEDKLKSEKGKQKVREAKAAALSHIDSNKDAFAKTFQIHHHLQNAKNALVSALDSGQEFEHSIGGKATGPEGHVAIVGGKPTKLVNRAEFSRANLLKNN